MKLQSIAILFATSLCFASSLFAQEIITQAPGAGSRLFTVPGVEFDDAQRAKVAEIRESHEEKLRELQQRRARLYTDEQRRAMRAAAQKERAAGKSGRELRDAVNAAIKVTEEQEAAFREVQDAQATLAVELRKELLAILTPEQQRTQSAQERPRQNGVRPTHANVKYGPHDRNVMDVWLAESDTPTPLLVSIHGGGFRGGNKSVSPALLQRCLDEKISVIAITYRLSQDAIAPASFVDSARAIQFMRHNAKQWNLDPQRIASTGGSAGAGISLWLAFHDDLADPDNADPVLRQSTRLTCAAVYNGQTSYDPRFIRDLFPGTDTYQHAALAQLYDVDLKKLDDAPAEKIKLFEMVSPIHHLTKDDVPVQLIYGSQSGAKVTSQGVGIHHPKFGEVLMEKMEKLDIVCDVRTGVSRNAAEWTDATFEFVKPYLITPTPE